MMPEGQDPDDLIRARGPKAMQAVLEGAEPLVRLLWRRETEGQVFDTPERRAGLDARLRAAVSRIQDGTLKRHYGEALNTLRRELFGAGRPASDRRPWVPRRGRGFAEAPVTPLSVTRTLAGQLEGERLRVALILTTLCRYPALIDTFEDRLDRLEPRDAGAGRLALFLLSTPERDAASLRAALLSAGQLENLERLEATGHLRITPFLSGREDIDAARTCLTEEFAKHASSRALAEELDEAAQDLAEDITEDDTTLAFRLKQAVREKHAALSVREEAGSDQFGDTADARAAFHALLNSAGQAKKN
jgi:DNA primase